MPSFAICLKKSDEGAASSFASFLRGRGATEKGYESNDKCEYLLVHLEDRKVEYEWRFVLGAVTETLSLPKDLDRAYDILL